MISSILKSNRPGVIIFIVLAGILIWGLSILNTNVVEISGDILSMPLYRLFGNIIPVNSLASIFVGFAFVLFQAFLLIQFNRKYILINYRTYLPAFFYILISGSFIPLQRFNPTLIGTIFIFLSLDYIFSIYREEYALNKLYLAGFFISIASLFWVPFSVFFIVIWISLSVLRPFIGREWIVSLLGFLTPYLFVFVFYFVVFDLSELTLLLENVKEGFSFIKEFNNIHLAYYLFYGFLLFIILNASYVLIMNFQMKKIRTRKYFVINWWLFVICLILFFFFKYVSFEIIYLISIPISFLLTNYFYTLKRNWYLNSIIIILIGLIVYIQITAHY
ncbi:MAG: hypothetical protein KAR57_01800 [Bacteroidales bacterium]|nr:hypothetical protein [Bacteroidales bacterium]